MNLRTILFSQYPALFLLAVLFLIAHLRVRKTSAVKSVLWVILFGVALAASVVCCFLGIQAELWTLKTLITLGFWSWFGVGLVLLFLVPSMNDCFPLFTGMACGRHKLSPQISPKKTIEGSVGGLVAAVVFAVLLPRLVCLLYGADASALKPAWYYALFGLMAGALAQIGDLAASLVKRDCGVKDFGKIFPGHGGVMDRLDGILFATLACYVFFRMMG